MKKLFTIAVVAMITSLAFAQAPLAKKKASINKIERLADLNVMAQKAKEAKEMKAAMAEKAAVANETSSSVFRKSSVNKWGLFQNMNGGGKVVMPFVMGNFRSAVAEQPNKSNVRKTTTQEGNLTITTDEHGIITDVTGVEAKTYLRAATGTAYFVSNQKVAFAAQSGAVTVIEDGNNVYIKDPITRCTAGSWVKGTKTGNTITVAAKQPLAYNSQYNATFSLRWGKIAGTSVGNDDTIADAFTFTVNGNVLTLEGTLGYKNAAGGDAPFMGAFWDDDNTFQYGDAETVLTYDPTYVAPSTELVTLPAGLEVAEWYLNGTSVSSSAETPVKNQKINVAFAGNDVYVQGISTDFPTAWVKGTINGTTITFEKFQYVGQYSSTDCWFIGVDATGETAVIKDAMATYDADTKTITFIDDVLINADAFRILYVNWYTGVVLTAEAKEFTEPIITDLTATLPYSNTLETTAEQAEAAIYDANDDNSTFTIETSTTGIEGVVARYRYNSNNAGDDYLVFPGVELKTGKKYKVSVDASGNGYTFTERFEVVAGKEAKASQLTIPVIEPTDVSSNKTFTTYTNNEFSVTEDGTYFLAVHAISDKDKFYLFVDNFSIAELDEAAPSPVTDLVLTPDPNGAKKVGLSFKAPAKTVGGLNISGLVKVKIERDGEWQTTMDVAPGATSTYNDVNGLTDGYHTYTLTSMLGDFESSARKGEPVSEKTYVGWDTPDVVGNVTVADKSSSVDIAWEAPTKGANGFAFNPADCKYNVYPVEIQELWGMTFPVTDKENPYATALTETSANIAFNTNEGDMGFTYFAVTAENTVGESEDVYGAVVTGKPYELPMFESVADGQSLAYWWGYATDEYNRQMENSGLFLGENPSDGDAGNLLMAAEVGGWIELQSGKIALAGAVNPVVTFDYQSASAVPLTVTVITPNGEKEMQTFTCGADYASATVSLKEFANEDWVRVFIKGAFSAAGEVNIDNIRIYNKLDNNLVAKGINATSKVQAGDDVTVTVDVENQGSLAAAADAYTVDLYCNDEKVDSKAGVELASNATTTFTFTEATNVMSPAEMVWKAVIVFEADGDKTNNETATAKTTIKTTNYPAVTDLAGTQADNSVKLTWSEPDMTAAPAEPVTDSFEDYESFAVNNAGDWSFIDGDGSTTYGFNGLQFQNNGAEMAYIVFDSSDPVFSGDEETAALFTAKSGVKYMASFAATTGPNNDWMISPELNGDAQTVSFFAKTYTDQYGSESFEFYYSTTGKEVSDFVKVESVDAVPTDWTEYTYNIPAGAKYFAIRCTSNDKFIFLVDDVTYIPAGASAGDLSLVGYNIYRDGVKINEAPVEETTYTDAAATDGEHSYVVTVVYDKGESKASNVVVINFTATGINDIAAKASNISIDNNAITIANAEGLNVSVYTADGKAVYNAAGSSLTTIPVKRGMYIVKVGKETLKAVVK